MSKLIKSSSDRMFAGVCGGLGRYFNVDTTLIRIGFAAATVIGVGSPVLIYILMALIVPNEDGSMGFQ